MAIPIAPLVAQFRAPFAIDGVCVCVHGAESLAKNEPSAKHSEPSRCFINLRNRTGRSTRNSHSHRRRRPLGWAASHSGAESHVRLPRSKGSSATSQKWDANSTGRAWILELDPGSFLVGAVSRRVGRQGTAWARLGGLGDFGAGAFQDDRVDVGLGRPARDQLLRVIEFLVDFALEGFKGLRARENLPLMKKDGVPRAPTLSAMAASASTESSSFLSCKAALNLLMLRPMISRISPDWRHPGSLGS